MKKRSAKPKPKPKAKTSLAEWLATALIVMLFMTAAGVMFANEYIASLKAQNAALYKTNDGLLATLQTHGLPEQTASAPPIFLHTGKDAPENRRHIDHTPENIQTELLNIHVRDSVTPDSAGEE